MIRPRLLRPADTAAILGCSVKTLMKEVRLGELPYIRVGRRKKFDPGDIEAFIERRRAWSIVHTPPFCRAIRQIGASDLAERTTSKQQLAKAVQERLNSRRQSSDSGG